MPDQELTVSPADTNTDRTVSSNICGFYHHTVQERLEVLHQHVGIQAHSAIAQIAGGAGLDVSSADRMSENVIAVHGLPLSVGLHFRVNGTDYLVPMAVEESSVVAAASSAARMVRASGGFVGSADPSVMTAQIQFDDVPAAEHVSQRVLAHRAEILLTGDRAIPNIVARGGGCRDLTVRVLDPVEGVVTVDVFVDVCDAMGANVVDTLAEALAPLIHTWVGGRIGLRILSNLPMRRRVRVCARVTTESLGGTDAADGIVRASRFAELDPLRAVTHNKGFMNGLDAAALALGQDWRAIEAGAHAFAAWEGRYRPLSTWSRTEEGIAGFAELPLAVGTVGGIRGVHAGVRAAFELLGVKSARELAVVLASVGLASNLAALRALSTTGIQKGHMKLHARKSYPPSGCNHK